MSDKADANISPQKTTARQIDSLPAAAQRALKEAEERREKLKSQMAEKPAEIGGRGGEDPARYGDWEVKGIAIDF